MKRITDKVVPPVAAGKPPWAPPRAPQVVLAFSGFPGEAKGRIEPPGGLAYAEALAKAGKAENVGNNPGKAHVPRQLCESGEAQAVAGPDLVPAVGLGFEIVQNGDELVSRNKAVVVFVETRKQKVDVALGHGPTLRTKVQVYVLLQSYY